MTRRLILFVVLLSVAGCSSGGAETTVAGAAPTTTRATGTSTTTATGIRLVPIGRFAQPTTVAAPPGDTHRVFVLEKGGRVRVVRDGRPLPGAFLDLRTRVASSGEQGLLGIAFAPDYAQSGRFYVYFTRRDGRQTLVEYRRSSDPDRAQRGSARTLFVHDDAEPNHNGGQLQFGPDGLLYVGTGDGGGGNDEHGSRGNAQDLGSPLGKLLRIDPRPSGGQPYRIPPSNPFVGRAGARAEIYAYGLRNPWRFSFDRSTGAIAIADVGQDRYEEIDYRPRGGARGVNFGWRPFEGRTRLRDEPAPGHVPPQVVLSHSDGWCSITGGYIVRDPGLRSLAGRYLFGDLCKGGIWSTRLSARSATRPVRVPGGGAVSSTTTFGQDARGRLYVASLSGPVYRIAAR